ncbi:hypothetical protein HPB47_008261 [Ixodes persulcatus]|uniref:Uncharacterized protein n=1 Tax=Ixodes persulcatus TaxID=34615 RepID=A0AC60P559_IXOPE|nr:hypothetical protein HPB47_008261 [Ixodes persulcatus]
MYSLHSRGDTWRLDTALLRDEMALSSMMRQSIRTSLSVTPMSPARWEIVKSDCRFYGTSAGKMLRLLRHRVTEALNETTSRIFIVQRGGTRTRMMSEYLVLTRLVALPLRSNCIANPSTTRSSHILKTGEVPSSFLCGRVILLPKDGSPPDPAARRPLTTMNMDYKLVASLLVSQRDDKSLVCRNGLPRNVASYFVVSGRTLIFYGTTECSPVITGSRPEGPIGKWIRTVGKPLGHVEVKIVDNENRVVPLNNRGELCARGYLVFLGYYNDEQKTEELVQNGWGTANMDLDECTVGKITTGVENNQKFRLVGRAREAGAASVGVNDIGGRLESRFLIRCGPGTHGPQRQSDVGITSCTLNQWCSVSGPSSAGVCPLRAPRHTAHENIDADPQWVRDVRDEALMSEDGTITITGRIRDMICRGGENVYPLEIEDFLYKHPDIEEVQVVGVPDRRLGEEVCAWIKLKPGTTTTEDEIREFCRGQVVN